MKPIYLTSLLLAAALTACSDDDNDWQPGPDYGTTSQIEVTSPMLNQKEVGSGETATTSITFSRADATEALTVPLTLSDTEHFEGPEAITFEQGSKTASAQINFKGAESGQFDCNVSLPFGVYNSPYTQTQNSATFRVLVLEWEVVSDNVRFYSSETASPKIPDMYTTLLKAKGMDIYRIKNLFKDYDLTFRLEESDGYKYITPMNGGKTGDDYCQWGMTVWYPYEDGDNDSHPYYWTTDPDHYYDYVWFGLRASNMSSYMVPESNWGLLSWYFCLYDLSGNYNYGTWDYTYFVW